MNRAHNAFWGTSIQIAKVDAFRRLIRRYKSPCFYRKTGVLLASTLAVLIEDLWILYGDFELR